MKFIAFQNIYKLIAKIDSLTYAISLVIPVYIFCNLSNFKIYCVSYVFGKWRVFCLESTTVHLQMANGYIPVNKINFKVQLFSHVANFFISIINNQFMLQYPTIADMDFFISLINNREKTA